MLKQHVKSLCFLFIILGFCNSVRIASAEEVDTTFGGGDGFVKTDLQGGNDSVSSMVINSSGQILVAGHTDRNGSLNDFGLVRYTSNGVLDTTFGSGDGFVVTDIRDDSDSPTSMVIDSDGRIVVAGYTQNDSTDFAVVRYTSSGVLDTSFGGGDGIVTTDIGGYNDFAQSIVIDDSGKIVVGGSSYNGSEADFTVVRYTSSGVLDTSFGGGDGIVTTNIAYGGSVTSVAIDDSGKIVVAGYSSTGDANISLVRYTSSGALDTSFGGGDGIVVTDIRDESDYSTSMVIDSDGRIVVAGYTYNGSDNDFAVVRYTSSGVLDTSFGGGDGIVTTDAGEKEFAHSIALDSSDNIVVAGSIRSIHGSDIALARYTSSGKLDGNLVVVKSGAGDGGGGCQLTSVSNSVPHLLFFIFMLPLTAIMLVRLKKNNAF